MVFMQTMKNTKTVYTQELTKLHILFSNHCESKIRTACSVFPDREWSGAAFYKVEYLNGKTKDTAKLPEDIQLRILDFCLQDVGNAVYTEYDLNEDTASYLADHIDTLLGAKVCLLHSHNHMNTFLSGTDMTTLHEQAEQCNNVLTIVVNNAGTYYAKFIQKVNSKENNHIVTDTEVSSDYKLLGDSDRHEESKSTTANDTTDEYVELRTYDCELTIPQNMLIDEEFKQECLSKEKEFKLKKESKKTVSKVVLGDKHHQTDLYDGWFGNNNRWWSDGNLWNQDKDYTVKSTVGTMVKSILFLTLNTQLTSYCNYWENYPVMAVSPECIELFMEVFFEYYSPDIDQCQELIDDINDKLSTYDSEKTHSIQYIITEALGNYIDYLRL